MGSLEGRLKCSYSYFRRGFYAAKNETHPPCSTMKPEMVRYWARTVSKSFAGLYAAGYEAFGELFGSPEEAYVAYREKRGLPPVDPRILGGQ